MVKKKTKKRVAKKKKIKKVKNRKRPKPRKKKSVARALVLCPAKLPSEAIDVLGAPTPKEFVKTRTIRGGRKATYVEGGYVVAKLNQAFGPINWDFEVLDEKKEIDGGAKSVKCVVVKGRLTIKDHVRGFSVGKTQYGQSEIKDNIPLGDIYKAAATDSLKKCASLFGVALDIYWPELDLKENGEKEKTVKKDEGDKLFKAAKEMIQKGGQTDRATLTQIKKNIEGSKIYTVAQKYQLAKIIDAKLKN